MTFQKPENIMKHSSTPTLPGGLGRRGAGVLDTSYGRAELPHRPLLSTQRTNHWFRLGLALLVLSWISLASSALAQDRKLTGTVIAGGSSTSSGDKFVVAGAVGKPDSSTMKLQGTKFTATIGETPIIVLQTPGAPRLSVTYSNNTATLSWPQEFEGWTLQQTPALGASSVWTESQGVANNQLTISMPTGKVFFRLQKVTAE